MTHELEGLRRVTSTLLDSQTIAHSLRPEVIELASILSASQSITTISKEDISRGETLTSNGIALSPTMAAMCADDFMRTIKFIRGTHASIVDTREKFPGRPARVLYVGCGPYATLAPPAMNRSFPIE